jgi:DNA-binding NarL/FixJ family response regulator
MMTAGGLQATEGASRPTCTILVVEDQRAGWQLIERPTIARGWKARRAATVQAALAALVEAFAGLVVDLGLPDGSGYEVIAAARKARPRIPILIVTGIRDDDDINRAQALGVQLCRKPCEDENVARFLSDCEAWLTKNPTALVDDLAQTYGLKEGPRRVLTGGVITTERKLLAQRLNLSLDTVKSHVSTILELTGASSFEDLVIPIREAGFR